MIDKIFDLINFNKNRLFWLLISEIEIKLLYFHLFVNINTPTCKCVIFQLVFLFIPLYTKQKYFLEVLK